MSEPLGKQRRGLGVDLLLQDRRTRAGTAHGERAGDFAEATLRLFLLEENRYELVLCQFTRTYEQIPEQRAG